MTAVHLSASAEPSRWTWTSSQGRLAPFPGTGGLSMGLCWPGLLSISAFGPFVNIPFARMIVKERSKGDI